MYDILIVGAGPAGASAALFAAKAGKKTVVIDSDQSITKRAWVENHYGVMEVTGPELVETGKKQAAKFGAELVTGKVENIVKTDNGFRAETENGHYEAAHVLLATGVMADLVDKIGLQVKAGTEPHIKTNIEVDRDGKTSIDGIWAAGTIAGVSVHTIVTAGDGARVAINILSAINGTRYVDHDVMK
ncbi:pyridine nucleotide-disulfide oxidoreductase [Tumebacillus algifaecis]|uniref:Pyridine nucleotide-disulfide oxidoreductase n=1 Tax=Tumebacillus algifaecis TaxID=1214604 RepID=A0A223CY53_9BACL|nr:FAD-dependent oxidoreductase [Tumebacillus algifaecis]ASS74043.1 pyridine nucleotide-disulfide oxidoreductase [Tumebacillus algifaecis]